MSEAKVILVKWHADIMKVIRRIPFQRGLINISNWFSMPTEDAYFSRHLLLSDLGNIKDFDKSNKPSPMLALNIIWQ